MATLTSAILQNITSAWTRAEGWTDGKSSSCWKINGLKYESVLNTLLEPFVRKLRKDVKTLRSAIMTCFIYLGPRLRKWLKKSSTTVAQPSSILRRQIGRIKLSWKYNLIIWFRLLAAGRRNSAARRFLSGQNFQSSNSSISLRSYISFSCLLVCRKCIWNV